VITRAEILRQLADSCEKEIKLCKEQYEDIIFPTHISRADALSKFSEPYFGKIQDYLPYIGNLNPEKHIKELEPYKKEIIATAHKLYCTVDFLNPNKAKDLDLIAKYHVLRTSLFDNTAKHLSMDSTDPQNPFYNYTAFQNTEARTTVVMTIIAATITNKRAYNKVPTTIKNENIFIELNYFKKLHKIYKQYETLKQVNQQPPELI
jgi:hypothetical protein